MDIINVTDDRHAWRARIRLANQAFFRFPPAMMGNARWWWVVVEGGDLVGFAGACPDNNEDVFLGPCGVHDQFRGRGIQKSLIALREGFACSQGYSRTVTFTNVNNYASANNLIASGYRLGPPWRPFHRPELSLFWRKNLVGVAKRS